MSTAKQFGMNTMDKDNHETRIALLEQSTGNINETLLRIEKRFDNLDKNIYNLDKKLDTKIDDFERKVEVKLYRVEDKVTDISAKIDSNNKWLITTFITSFFALVGTVVSIVNFFIHT